MGIHTEYQIEECTIIVLLDGSGMVMPSDASECRGISGPCVIPKDVSEATFALGAKLLILHDDEVRDANIATVAPQDENIEDDTTSAGSQIDADDVPLAPTKAKTRGQLVRFASTCRLPRRRPTGPADESSVKSPPRAFNPTPATVRGATDRTRRRMLDHFAKVAKVDMLLGDLDTEGKAARSHFEALRDSLQEAQQGCGTSLGHDAARPMVEQEIRRLKQFLEARLTTLDQTMPPNPLDPPRSSGVS
eukprot:NODE_586_length_862_cov_663.312423_g445_i0.p1 GENE.NODE_586_length_862_cov_663.312423_g445_i0~~NODE_586_length_862_cov_663.312423_g445_i0.p1  ORF type:complete len:248 (-),score=42.87 NODE_586_length_862_cov_663.312423_g445_i0:86-829(-)